MCPFLKYILTNSQNEKGQENVLIIPDYKISTITSFLEMIYTGSTWVEGVNEFEKMKQFGFKLLGFFMGLNANVKLEKKMNTTKKSKPVQKEPDNYQYKDLATSSNVCTNNNFNYKPDESLYENVSLPSAIAKQTENPSKRCKTSTTSSNSDIAMATESNDLTQALPFTTEDILKERSNSRFLFDKEMCNDGFTFSKNEVFDILTNKKAKSELSEHELLLGTNKPEEPKKRQEQREWECKTCLEKLPTKNELIHHSVEVHHDPSPFVCIECPKRYTTLQLMKNHHKIIHLDEKNIICDKCGQRFGYKRGLKRHLKRCENPPKEKFECDFCNAKFSSKQVLKGHIERAHKL
jgi:hypothetical protein